MSISVAFGWLLHIDVHTKTKKLYVMKKNIARCILWCIRWKFVCLEEMLACKKAIIIAGPHTSMWDFVIGKLVYVAAGLPSKFLVSDRLFVFPFNFILPWLGAYRLNRKHPKVVAEIVDVFKTSDCILTICPEGRHAKTFVWGSGFYKIAIKANVPVKIASIDYKNKQCLIGDAFVITGDFDIDMQQLKEFYRAEQARFPERFAHHGERGYLSFFYSSNNSCTFCKCLSSTWV